MANLTKADIEHLAHLSRLELTDAEKDLYAHQLSAVLEYMEILNEVNTDGVEPTAQVTGLQDVYREDVVHDCPKDSREEIVALFPDAEGAALKVPAALIHNKAASMAEDDDDEKDFT
ncbi:MAG: gatC [Candidatus Magasanikbacteria bacterium]|nr:gatC [Candidatus Magasanikbacteria bacterium]